MANTSTSKNLFPILENKASGLAALAACASAAGEGHLVEYKKLTSRKILNKTISHRGLSLAYSINPYRGCEFACRYCYARYTHTFFQGKKSACIGSPDFEDPSLFERLIFVKQNAGWLVEQELRAINPGQEIAIGTATDPYQPIERRERVTESILKVFAKRRGHRIGIVTKSNLILRDLDLLRQIAEQNTLVIHVTVTTPDRQLARLLEPRAPRPDLRLQAVRALAAAGLQVGILCSPLLPGITDSACQIDHMAELAAEAGASFFAAEPLFLKPCSRPTYLSFVREHFPQLEAQTAKRFADREFADRDYRQALARHVGVACRRHHILQRSTDALLTRDAGLPRAPEASHGRQALLFADESGAAMAPLQ